MIESIKKIFHITNPCTNTGMSVEEKIETMYNSLAADEITLKVGSDLTKFSQNIVSQIGIIRENTFETSGFIIPKVRLLSAENFQENEYEIAINNEVLYSGFTLLNEDDAVFDIINNFKDTCHEKLDKLFTNSVTEKYIDIVQKNNSRLVWNLSNVMPLWGIKYILINILQKGKSIKNINLLFEKMCEYSTKSKTTSTPYDIAEKVFNECCK